MLKNRSDVGQYRRRDPQMPLAAQDSRYLGCYSLLSVAYSPHELNEIKKAIAYFDSRKCHYFWRDLYDNWKFPFTYKFDFVEKEDFMLCKLFIGGKQVNLGLTKQTK